MSNTELTVNEAMESLTGFDEIAIEQSMKYDVYTDDESGNAKPVLLMRCLVFVMERRGGLDDGAARQAAMNLSVKEVNGYFSTEPEEVDPEAPDTEPGKDASQPHDEPDGSQSSAS